MNAIFKRELRAYFNAPLGFVLIAVAYFFTNYYFFTYNLYGNTTDFTTLSSMLFSVVLFLVPVLTMRLLVSKYWFCWCYCWRHCQKHCG